MSIRHKEKTRLTALAAVADEARHRLARNRAPVPTTAAQASIENQFISERCRACMR